MGLGIRHNDGDDGDNRQVRHYDEVVDDGGVA